MKHGDPEAYFARTLTEAVQATVRELLQTKHLYQSVTLNLKGIADEAQKDLAPEIVSQVKHFERWAKWHWMPYSSAAALHPRFQLGQRQHIDWRPTDIRTFCATCDSEEPFNWVAAQDMLAKLDDRGLPLLGSQGNQVFCLTYLCQNCKGIEEVFMVQRKDLRLTLCGRAPMETVQVPRSIHKAVKKYYSSAVVAFQSGQVLSGLFMLRTLCEQWSRFATNNKTDKADVVNDQYMAGLPPDFKARFPSLVAMYTKLSAAIHAADESVNLFEEVSDEIAEHFDARRVFKLSP